MVSAEPTPNEPTLTAPPSTEAPSLDEEAKHDTNTPTDVEESGAIFQAVGIIVGEVHLGEDGKNTITIDRSEYQLFYIPSKRRVFDALKKEIEATGNHHQRLIVYPKVIHFPRREQPHQMAFQLVGFDRGREQEAVSKELDDLEFKFSGLWQFIPVCQTPCISVFRNFTRERLDFIKQAEPVRKVKFMKASHIPLLWKDAPIRPFRFNPKIEKEQQGHPIFVTLKAKFLPGRNVFGFVALLAPPQETAPKFLKASKKDKAEVQQAARKNAKSVPPVTKKENISAPVAKPKPKPKSPTDKPVVQTNKPPKIEPRKKETEQE